MDKGSSSGGSGKKGSKRVPLRALARIASVAAGVQFGWALQLSLLTPYVQELGIPHTWASYIWLCGPISGFIMQPLIGHSSDNCQSKYGRRRPFIVMGTFLVILAVLLIGYAADLGFFLGDSPLYRPRAITIFVFGFWILDLANNTLQGPCRALLADFTGKNQKRTRRANSFFSFFMAVGNVLGYAAGSVENWYKIFPFSRTDACGMSCANLKCAFLIGILVLFTTVILSITAAPEIPWSPDDQQSSATITSTTPFLNDDGMERKGSSADEGKYDEEDEDDMETEEEMREAFLWELICAFRDLPPKMWSVLIITALTWIAWFPFMLYDTDWMGRDVYGGSTVDESSSILYGRGVRMGSLGLMIQSVVLGLFSLCVEPLCRKVGTSYVWAAGNFIITTALIGTAVLTKFMPHPPNAVSIAGALVIFAVLGLPLAVTYSIPYALTATLTSNTGGGQGLSMGVLNMGVVVPQVLVSIGSGPLDTLFGGGNIPSFLVGAGSAFLGMVLSVWLLPRPPPDFFSTGMMQTSLRRTLSSPIP